MHLLPAGLVTSVTLFVGLLRCFAAVMLTVIAILAVENSLASLTKV